MLLPGAIGEAGGRVKTLPYIASYFGASVGEALEPPVTGLQYRTGVWGDGAVRADVGIRPYKGIWFCVWKSGNPSVSALR